MAPKRNKSNSQSSFYYFVVDFKNQQGNRSMNFKDASIAAGPLWKNMNKEQRRPYVERAAMEKQQAKGGKLTSDGVNVEDLEHMERMEQLKIQEMKDEINRNLQIARDTGRIQNELFSIIHINTFCCCSNKYYPAEIAVACFTLEDGVTSENVFHRIIKPGELPLGYAGEAKLQSDETHQIPPPRYGEGSNLREVYAELKKFLFNKLSGSKRLPTLYADEKMVKMTQQILDDFCQTFNDDRLFEVHNLQYMFKVLRNIVANNIVWPTDTYSAREIEKDVYSHVPEIACEFHKISEVIVYCSRSAVIRYSYTICDNCCGDLHITLVPGAHIPPTKSAFRPMSRSSSKSSLFSTSEAHRLKQSFQDDDSESLQSFSSKSEWDNQSVTSDSYCLSVDNDFPNLGKHKKKSFVPNSSADSQTGNQYSGKSYAGATGTTGYSVRPAELSSVSKVHNNLRSNESVPSSSFNQTNEFPALMGRGKALGRGRKIN